VPHRQGALKVQVLHSEAIVGSREKQVMVISHRFSWRSPHRTREPPVCKIRSVGQPSRDSDRGTWGDKSLGRRILNSSPIFPWRDLPSQNRNASTRSWIVH